MKRFINFGFQVIFMIGTIVLISGCDKFFDVNDDTDLPSAATPNLLLTPIQGLMATNCYEQGETSAYFAQQIATLNGFNSVKDRWDYTSVTRVGLFRRHFHDVASNARNLYNTANAEGSKNYEGAGHTMMVLSTQTATDLFGQMPYREALQGNPSPAYDEQSIIYDGMLDEIDLAISLFRASSGTDRIMVGNGSDRMYNGKMEYWEAFAHGIKARILLHLTPNINQDYQPIIDEVDLALSLFPDFFAEYDYEKDQVNAYLQNQWGPARSKPEWDYTINILGQSAPTPFLLESVMGYDPEEDSIKDPRQSLLMEPGQYSDSVRYYTDAIIATEDTVGVNLDSMILVVLDTTYLSVAPSEGRSQLIPSEKYPNLYGSYMTEDFSTQPYMTEEELHFIKAEAAFRSGQLSTAFQSFQDGIERHMERVGVAQIDITAFMASDMVPNTVADLTLSHIMMQKWLAMYLQLEAWVDMRRYQYDSKIYKGLKRPENLAFFWDENETGKWIQRIPYDNQTEEIFNKPELDRLGAFQNPDWLKVPLWWATSN